MHVLYFSFCKLTISNWIYENWIRIYDHFLKELLTLFMFVSVNHGKYDLFFFKKKKERMCVDILFFASKITFRHDTYHQISSNK